MIWSRNKMCDLQVVQPCLQFYSFSQKHTQKVMTLSTSNCQQRIQVCSVVLCEIILWLYEPVLELFALSARGGMQLPNRKACQERLVLSGILHPRCYITQWGLVWVLELRRSTSLSARLNDPRPDSHSTRLAVRLCGCPVAWLSGRGPSSRALRLPLDWPSASAARSPGVSLSW